MEIDLSKPNKNWSHSRFSTFASCKNKYKLQYLANLVCVGKKVEVTDKGLSLHHIAEQMDSKISLEELLEIAKKDLDTREFDKEKFPILKIIPRFYEWWQEFIVPFENNGFKLYKENWERGNILDKTIVGALDTLLVNEDTKEVRIYDFKTGKKADASPYKNQMLLYVYLIGKRLGIENLSEKIKIFIFFPLASISEEEFDNREIAKKLALKTMKQIVFSNEDVNNVIQSLEGIIKEDKSIDWQNSDPMNDAKLGYYCSWCDFVGNKQNCPLSYDSGCRFPRSAKIIHKDELKKNAETESK